MLGRRCVVCWSPRAAAARQQRKHQLTGSAIPAQGNGLSSASQGCLNHDAMHMKTRPRQGPGWETLGEVMDKEIAEFRSRVALAS